MFEVDLHSIQRHTEDYLHRHTDTCMMAEQFHQCPSWKAVNLLLIVILCNVSRCGLYYHHIHCVSKKRDYIFYNNFNNKCPITTIFGIVSSN